MLSFLILYIFWTKEESLKTTPVQKRAKLFFFWTKFENIFYINIFYKRFISRPSFSAFSAKMSSNLKFPVNEITNHPDNTSLVLTGDQIMAAARAAGCEGEACCYPKQLVDVEIDANGKIVALHFSTCRKLCVFGLLICEEHQQDVLHKNPSDFRCNITEAIKIAGTKCSRPKFSDDVIRQIVNHGGIAYLLLKTKLCATVTNKTVSFNIAKAGESERFLSIPEGLKLVVKYDNSSKIIMVFDLSHLTRELKNDVVELDEKRGTEVVATPSSVQVRPHEIRGWPALSSSSGHSARSSTAESRSVDVANIAKLAKIAVCGLEQLINARNDAQKRVDDLNSQISSLKEQIALFNRTLCEATPTLSSDPAVTAAPAASDAGVLHEQSDGERSE